MISNLSYVVGRGRKVIAGVELSPWLDKKTNTNGLVTIVGQTLGGRPARERPFRAIPVSKNSKPAVNNDVSRAIAGTFEKVSTTCEDGTEYQQTVLTAYKENGVWYAITRTGLFVDERGNTNADLNRLIFNGTEIKPHGSFSLDGKSVTVESAQGLELSNVEATRLRHAVQRSSIPLLGSPEYRHDLWAIPVGAAVLIRDVDGTLFRLVGERDQLIVVDANGYDQVFEDMEMRRREENDRARKARLESRTPNVAPAIEISAAADIQAQNVTEEPTSVVGNDERKGGWLSRRS